MKKIPCPNCIHEDYFGLVEVTDDYITLECPECQYQFAICAASDLEK